MLICGGRSRICGRCCYHAITMLLGCTCCEGGCGEESPRCWGAAAGKGGCGEESADGAVTMLFAAVGGRCWGARLRR